jgi:hypothetical protein
MQQFFFFNEIILNFFQILSLLKPLLVLSYFSNLKSHFKIPEKAVIKQYFVYNLVLLQYMAYFKFVTDL